MNWSHWTPMPSPTQAREIAGPDGPGVYELKLTTGELIQFGISKTCCKRMKSLFPAPYGTGKRNNGTKREFVLKNWRKLEYRTLATATRESAKEIEDRLKAMNNHKFNT